MYSVTLGSDGPHVTGLGLGCMGMSDFYGAAEHDESIATLRAARDRGLDFFDTGDFYGAGHNELLLREAFDTAARQKLIYSVKFGAMRDPAGGFVGFDCRPAAVKSALAYSLQRLGTDYIDIYRPARLDPEVPIEETVGAIARLVEEGYVRHIGLSEVGVATLRRAQAVHPIADLQIEFSLLARGIEAAILPTCRELGIGITAYGVLGRGLLSGRWSPDGAVGDTRKNLPRFGGANLAHNLKIVERLKAVAVEKGVTVGQLAIAWVACQGPDILPLAGSRRRGQLEEALAALDIVLTPADLERIGAIAPPGAAAGDRYDRHGMARLDSETPEPTGA
jgi:aryl-alcohol dehydrogenase-like predicted oxidoreductase